MSFFFLILTFCIILFSGCNEEKVNILSYNLKRTDFIEKINAGGTVQAVNTRTIVAPRVNVSSMTVRYLAEDGAYVKKGDTICILDAPQLLNYLESVNTSLENTMAEMKKLEADNAMNLSVLQAQIDINEVKVALNSLDSVQQRFAPPVRQRIYALELEKANVEKMKLRKKFTAQKRIDDAELRSMKSRISQSEIQAQKYKDQINSLIITAPQDGIVMHTESPVIMIMSSMGPGTLGGKIEVNSSVWSNMVLLQMPDLNQMQVSVEVPESDYKRIETGQKVYIAADAVKDLGTTGTVKRKTLVGKKKEAETSIKTYEVIISLDSCHSLLKPGLSASCSIIVNEVKDTIVVPTLAIFERDSSKIIYVAGNEKFIPVQVETGLSNSSESIVSKGLKGDEIIALTEPPHKLIARKPEMEKKNIIITDSVKTETIVSNIH